MTKLSADGSSLIYSTYLGGQYADRALAVAVNAAGEAYVVGSTGSDDFPLMNPYDSTRGAAVDGFVAKLNATGTGIVYSTYFGGGTWNEAVNDVAIDAAGSAYVTGYTDADTDSDGDADADTDTDIDFG